MLTLARHCYHKLPMPGLSTPISLGDAQLRNRNVLSAMTRNRASSNVPNQYNSEYYTQRAVGGAGLVVTEGTLVTQQGYVSLTSSVTLPSFVRRTEWPNAPGIWSTDQIRAWSRIVQSVHNAGGTIFCQASTINDTKLPRWLITSLNSAVAR